MDKLYIVVRSDLPPGLQVAQACHAMRQFSAEHPEIDQHWYQNSNNLVVLQVPSEAHLLALLMDAKGIKISAFCEPDLDDALTAIAVAPQGARLLSQLPLALRPAATEAGSVSVSGSAQ